MVIILYVNLNDKYFLFEQYFISLWWRRIYKVSADGRLYFYFYQNPNCSVCVGSYRYSVLVNNNLFAWNRDCLFDLFTCARKQNWVLRSILDYLVLRILNYFIRIELKTINTEDVSACHIKKLLQLESTARESIYKLIPSWYIIEKYYLLILIKPVSLL